MANFSLSSPVESSSSRESEPELDQWAGRQQSKPSFFSLSRYVSTKSRFYQARRSLAVVFIFVLAVIVWFVPPPSQWGAGDSYEAGISTTRPSTVGREGLKHDGPDPTQWLRENSNDQHAVTGPGFNKLLQSSKPRAALISLVRNQELDGIIQSMTQLEYHWNHKYQYPWVFFNDEPFNDEFKVC